MRSNRSPEDSKVSLQTLIGYISGVMLASGGAYVQWGIGAWLMVLGIGIVILALPIWPQE